MRGENWKGRTVVYSDGSLIAGGNVGGGAFVVETDGAEREVECRLGTMVTVWDGEIAGMAEGLARAPQGKVLILADSKAAVMKAGKMGKARSHHLMKVVDEIAARGGG